MVASALATAWFHRQRFTALVMLGIAGLASAVTFMALSAPDLALTQISVEVVSVILMLVALYLLPHESPREGSLARRARDIALGLAAGGGVAALTYAVLTRPAKTLSWFYLDESVPGGGGTNVVNVILVDFRGFDTFGEIAVLAIASIVIYALLQDAARQWRRHPLPTRTGIRCCCVSQAGSGCRSRSWWRPIFFCAATISRAAGFVAGLVTSVALIIQYLANGIAWAEQRMNVRFYRVSGAGLLIAGATGIGSFFFGAPFLTSTHGHPHLPVIGEVPLASAALFDLGVFLAVVGAMVLALTTLSGVEPGEREIAGWSCSSPPASACSSQAASISCCGRVRSPWCSVSPSSPTRSTCFSSPWGALVPFQPPIIAAGAAGYADPLPQALVLTAIVINLGMTALLLALAVRAALRHRYGSRGRRRRLRMRRSQPGAQSMIHLVMLPVLVPLAAGSLMLFSNTRVNLTRTLGFLSCTALVAIAIALFREAAARDLRRLSARQLARALRHRAGAGPPVGHPAAHHVDPGPRRASSMRCVAGTSAARTSMRCSSSS